MEAVWLPLAQHFLGVLTCKSCFKLFFMCEVVPLRLLLGGQLLAEILALLQKLPKAVVLGLGALGPLPEFLVGDLQPDDLPFEFLVFLGVGTGLGLGLEYFEQTGEEILRRDLGIAFAPFATLQGGVGQPGLHLLLEGVSAVPVVLPGPGLLALDLFDLVLKLGEGLDEGAADVVEILDLLVGVRVGVGAALAGDGELSAEVEHQGLLVAEAAGVFAKVEQGRR